MSVIISGSDVSPWAKPVGMHAMMARYQAFTGLKPIGPHRSLADSLLKDITCKCGTCNGTGLHGTYGGMGWLACPTCHGMGDTYRIGIEELQALRQQVIDRYPDAAVSGWCPGLPIRCPVLRLDGGPVIDACPQWEGDPVQLELPV